MFQKNGDGKKKNEKNVELEKKRIILIGLGPHAQRIYFPLIKNFSSERGIELCLVVDVEEKREDITRYLEKNDAQVETFFIPTDKKTYSELHPEVETFLNEFVKSKRISGVIISTEPLTHVMYAQWALKNDISILMDKPISTHMNVSTDMACAKRLVDDYDTLVTVYKTAIRKNSDISFSIMAQRRFHPAFKKIREMVREVFEKTKCPITSIQTFYTDGQWRMPVEIVNQLYHPYTQGYGICSHSGYHFFDIVQFILDCGTDECKKYDSIEVFTNFVKPNDFMAQLNMKDYESIFGKETYNEHIKCDETWLKERMVNCGEIDAFTNICFKQGDKTLTLASINLAHNGFARRYWPTAKDRDLYKGNGRVRHEFHIIEQGPFQCIHYHSYQSKEVDPSLKQGIYDVGGEYHLKIYVFRNSDVLGGKTLEIFDVKDLDEDILEGKSRGHQENARARAYFEFIEALHGKITRNQMTSDLLTHKLPVLIMSAIYQSAILRSNNENPVVKMVI